MAPKAVIAAIPAEPAIVPQIVQALGVPIAASVSLGLFQPYGMESSQEVFQVIPAGVHTVDDLKLWDSALEKFQSGDWELATTELLNLPPTDSARRFMSTFIDQHKRVPPDGWTGVVQLHSK